MCSVKLTSEGKIVMEPANHQEEAKQRATWGWGR